MKSTPLHGADDTVTTTATPLQQAAARPIVCGDTVQLEYGSTVRKYKIVEAGDVDTDHGDTAIQYVSLVSPLGKEILGKQVGDSVKVSGPLGPLTFKISHVESSL